MAGSIGEVENWEFDWDGNRLKGIELLVSDKNKEQSSENAKLLMYRPNDSGETAIKKSKPHTQNSNSN
jgi:hypothetical protein